MSKVRSHEGCCLLKVTVWILRWCNSYVHHHGNKILGPLLFLNTTDLTIHVPHNTVDYNQFGDDTCLLSVHPRLQSAHSRLQDFVNSAGEWLTDWRMEVNYDKTVTMQHILARRT